MGGHISGEFLECVRPNKIVQKWRLKSWPDGMWVVIGVFVSSQWCGQLASETVFGDVALCLLPSGHYSRVTMELKQNITSTELSLHQTEVPEADCEQTKEGWNRHIFQRIKSTFGYGAQLFWYEANNFAAIFIIIFMTWTSWLYDFFMYRFWQFEKKNENYNLTRVVISLWRC